MIINKLTTSKHFQCRLKAEKERNDFDKDNGKIMDDEYWTNRELKLLRRFFNCPIFVPPSYSP